MGKKPVDRLEGLRIELNKKEREFLEDLALRQTFQTGGSVISDLGSATSSILSAFTNGGDAGLLLALGAVYVADSKLDLKTDKDLENWLNNFQLYSAQRYGIYPSVIPNENNGYGGPVCFVDPDDFPGDYYRLDTTKYGQVEGSGEGQSNAPYRRIMATYHEQIEAGTRTAPKPLPFDDKSWPWWIYVPGISYDDPVPQELGEYGRAGLATKYNFDLVLGGHGKLNDIVFVWNNQFDHYADLWTNLSPQIKMAMYIQGGGETRTEIDSLIDVLGAIDNVIPGASVVREVASASAGFFVEVGSDVVDTYQWAEKKVRKFGRWFANPTPSVTVSQPADASGAVTTTYVPEAGYVAWPSWAMPPNNLYKLQTIHSTVEVVKVLIPWYLGTKFAIEAAKAAGEIIPG